MSSLRALRPLLPILIGASIMLTMSMGLRQSLGVLMPALTKDVGVSVSQFTLAIAVQNLVWGFLQPFSGAWAVRVGYRKVMMVGSVLYVLGMVLLATAQGMLGITLGAGFAIGASMACTGSAIAMAVASRAVSAAVRSTVLGIVSAAGSLGAMLAAPIGQALSQEYGWRVGAYGFVLLALIIVPSAWYAGRVDALPTPPSPRGEQNSAWAATIQALKHPPFAVMTVAYFVCGMQLVFLTTHLPSYLDGCGLDPMLSAQALGMIGGFNILGSLFYGWAGGRWNKLLLLGGMYTLRSLGIAWYFLSDPSPANTLIFAAIMGFLWMGVGPLVAGYIGDNFGLRWQAMLGGVAFMTHQVGSFFGAFGGGLAYDALGSYTLALQVGVVLGLTAGLVQMAFAVARPGKPPSLATA
jgi:predicted MFS family arabinose efflux permease